MENECRNLVLHFSDEKEVLSRESILVNFNVFRENVIVEHNGKRYEVTRRSLNIDSFPIVIMNIYLELVK